VKIKVVNDESTDAQNRVNAALRIPGVSEAKTVWRKSISVSEICDEIEEDDIVLLDVGLEGIGKFGGFDVFFELLKQYYDGGTFKVSVIFDSLADCEQDLINQLSEEQKQIVKQLRAERKVVFAKEEFGGRIRESIKNILGFSFADACQKLFNPFLGLHVAVQHLQNNENPNPDLFAPVGEFEDDFFEPLQEQLQEAQNYLEKMVALYARQVVLESQVEQIEKFLKKGSLRMLCCLLNRESEPQKRLKEIQPLVIESGRCASFLIEFQHAVEALREIDAHRGKS